ncbi:MAG TPA: putative selenate ABC transporter substrate-binding protein [Edaphobacter sp.]|nr:putative selenate ABC transporter substrate-binding protein [Edaphobacter sp.]
MNRRHLLACLFATLLLSGCQPKPSTPKLRVSMIPSTDPGRIARESQPLIDYLQRETGATIEFTVPTSYAAVVEAITNDKVDIAYLGGFTYVQASSRAAVKPLVQRLQDKNFHSRFITQPDSPIQSLSDLKGHTFAFGDVNSTSGHLMPSYYMRQEHVDPAVIDKAIYTGGHDATALAVANKKVDAGAMDELVLEKMLKTGKVNTGQIRVFYTTPPFFDYVWVARAGLDPRMAEKFSQALLKLDAATPADKQVLDLLNAQKYAVANESDYSKLREAATDDGLLR